jgi:hypothetical protein
MRKVVKGRELAFSHEREKERERERIFYEPGGASSLS